MNQKILKLLQQTQLFSIQNKNSIIKYFISVEITLVLLVFGFFAYAYVNFFEVAIFTYDLGRNAGILALLFYILTLIPGILKRLQVIPQYLNPLVVSMTLFRRHLGIIMFLLAFIHNLFSRFLPSVVRFGFGPELANIARFEVMGMIALLLLFPVWITSNNFSQAKLGKLWKKIQSLTYLALFFIFLHVAWQNSFWAIIMLITIIAQIFSWFRILSNGKFKKT